MAHVVDHHVLLGLFRSPAKTSASGSSSRWSKQEKEQFEEGLVSLPNHLPTTVYCLKLQVAKVCIYSCRLSLVEGGPRSLSWWAAVLFSRSRAMPDSISNTR